MMIPYREWDQDAHLLKQLDVAEEQGKDTNVNICFPSCNYETYISQTKNYYMIATSNNHKFYQPFEKNWVRDPYPQEIVDIADYPDEIDVDDMKGYFWFPEEDIMISYVSFDELKQLGLSSWCKDCHSGSVYRVMGTPDVACIHCYKKKYGEKCYEGRGALRIPLKPVPPKFLNLDNSDRFNMMDFD